MMTTLAASSETLSQSKATAQKPLRIADPFAETDILDAVEVEPIELDKRLPFFKHLDGMVSLRRQWSKFWRYTDT